MLSHHCRDMTDIRAEPYQARHVWVYKSEPLQHHANVDSSAMRLPSGVVELAQTVLTLFGEGEDAVSPNKGCKSCLTGEGW